MWLPKSSNWIRVPGKISCTAMMNSSIRLSYSVTPDPGMAHAEVKGVVEEVDVVGAHVDGHRQTPGGWIPAQAV